MNSCLEHKMTLSTSLARRAPAKWSRSGRVLGIESPGVIDFLRGLNFGGWLLIGYPVFMLAVSRRRDSDAAALIDGSVLLQIAFTFTCALFLLSRSTCSADRLVRLVTRTPLKWLAGYLLLSLLSTAWSEQRMMTAFRATQAVVYFLLMADTVQELGSLQRAWKLLALCSVVIGLCVQMYQLKYQFSLSILHTSLVPGALVAAVFVSWSIRGTSWRLVSCCILGILVLGTSTATFVAVSVALAFSTLFYSRFRWMILTVITGVVALILVTGANGLMNLIFFGKSESNIATATGRTLVWEWSWNQLLTRPITGFGFAYGDAYARIHNSEGLRAQHMHNAFLSSAMNCGLPGLVLFALFWRAFVSWILRSPAGKERNAILFGALALFVNSFGIQSVSSPVSEAYVAHMLFFTSSIAFLRPRVGFTEKSRTAVTQRGAACWSFRASQVAVSRWSRRRPSPFSKGGSL